MKSLLTTGLRLVVLSLSTRVHSQLTENLQECATAEQAFAITDFFPDKISTPLPFAKTFTISYNGTYKVLTNVANNEKYLLYQCGTNPPSDEVNLDDYRVVTSIPLPDGVALTSTVQIPMLELLEERSAIKTYIGDKQYISSPCLLDMIENGEVENVPSNEITPYDPDDPGSVLWVAQWEAKYPDRIIIDNSFMTSAGQGTDKTMLENGYLEGPSKAIFEWIYFYAALFNKEKLAEQIVMESQGRYDCTAANAKTSFKEPQLVAVWAYFSNYPGYEGWLSGTCDPKKNYYCEYTEACNIKLLHKSAFMSDEEFVEFAKDADIFFYSSNTWDELYVEDQKKAVLDELKSVQNQQVFDHERSGEGTWWEQRMAEYDVVLEDICTIGGMVTDANAHERLYFRNVFTEQVGEKGLSEECPDTDAPLVSRATECSFVPTTAPTQNCNDVCKNKRGKKGRRCKRKCRKKNRGGSLRFM